MDPSSHTSARNARSAALHVPEGARHAVPDRILNGTAEPVEVLHHLFTADADDTLTGLAHTLHAQAQTLLELLDLGASDRAIGHAANLIERLADVLTSEIDKCDFERRGGGQGG